MVLPLFAVGFGLSRWWVGGWRYRVRLEWSGAVRPDKDSARLVYFWAGLVVGSPPLLVTLSYSLRYPSYRASDAAAPLWAVLPFVVLPFWAIWTTYRGVRAVFAVSPGKARIWFLVLPVLMMVLVFGLLGTALALLDRNG